MIKCDFELCDSERRGWTVPFSRRSLFDLSADATNAFASAGEQLGLHHVVEKEIDLSGDVYN